MITRTLLKPIIAITLLTAAGGRPAAAKVYRLWSRGDTEALLAGRLEGQTLYASAARLNGAPGHLRVLRHDADFASVRHVLHAAPRAAPGTPATYWQVGHQMAIGVTPYSAAAERILLLGLPDGGTLCFRFAPSGAAASPAGALPAGLPAVPGLVPDWTLDLEQSALALYSGVTADTPERVVDSLDGLLRRQGWQPAPEGRAAKPLPAAGGRIYLKGAALMAVQAVRARSGDGRTQVIVLRKGRD